MFGTRLIMLMVVTSQTVLASPALSQQFLSLGDLDEHTWGKGISGDGSVAIVTSSPWDTPNGGTVRAWRWTAPGGYQNLGALPPFGSASAGGLSRDGRVVVGTSFTLMDPSARAFRWSQEEGMTGLGLFPGMDYASASAVSANGEIAVGNCGATAFAPQTAVRWNESGDIEAIGFLPGKTSSRSLAVSGDGSVVVGASGEDSAARAFRWTSNGMDDLGVLPGTAASMAFGVSDDGSIVVGASGDGFYYPWKEREAFRWTPSGGMERLITSPLVTWSEATSTSADGTVIVGISNLGGFLWRESVGLVFIKEYLASLGLAVENFYDFSVSGVSANGTALIGDATYWVEGMWWGVRSPYVAIIERDCYPDFNGDGELDLFDFLQFVNEFNAGTDRADCTQEGAYDLFDFLCFTNAFNAGC